VNSKKKNWDEEHTVRGLREGSKAAISCGAGPLLGAREDLKSTREDGEGVMDLWGSKKKGKRVQIREKKNEEMGKGKREKGKGKREKGKGKREKGKGKREKGKGKRTEKGT
jgi:hypothetical protein